LQAVGAVIAGLVKAVFWGVVLVCILIQAFH